MADKFSVSRVYLHSAFLHGTPVAFLRLQSGSAFGWPPGVKEYEIVGWIDDRPVRRMTSVLQQIPDFEVVIYSLPVTPREMGLITESYARFLEMQAEKLGHEEPREPWEAPPEDILVQTKDQVGSNVVALLLEDGAPHVRIRSYPPFASASEFVSVIARAIETHKTSVPGNVSVFPVIRTWTVHLLNKECKLSNRDAIRLWNQSLGHTYGVPYTMDEAAPGLRGFSVAGPGEAQFSRDRRALVDRITHYQRTLTRRRPPPS